MNIYISDILSHTFKGKSTGHYFAVARNYQNIFSGNVIVAGGPVYKTEFSNEELLELPYNAGGGGLMARLKTFANARRLFRKTKGHTIVMQQCTTITTFLCIALFYNRSSKLFLIQYSREGFRSRVGKWLFKLAKHKIDGIICPNDYIGEVFAGIPYCIVPDYIYVDEKNEKNENIPFSKKKYDFCMVGRIASEKGVVEATRELVGTQYKVIIAGKAQTAELANDLHTICDNVDNIDLHLEYISEEDYLSYLRNSKYAILNYTGEYSERSSGVVYDTLFNGVPVIGRKCKALQFVKDYNLGVLLDNITELEPNRLLNETVYSNCIQNIDKYKKEHIKYINKLSLFICK